MVEFVALLAFVVPLGVWLLWLRRTISSALIYTILGITVAAGLVEMQARPKPIFMEVWRSPADAEVLWYALHEGESITVLLSLSGGPRLYVMPWDKDKAEQLARAGRGAGENGGTLRMRRPFERSLAPYEDLFYADPQPAPPPKE